MADFLHKYCNLLDEGYDEEFAGILADESNWDYYNGEPVDEWN